MKNCRGTINYIFSPHSLKILHGLGLLEQTEERSGCVMQNLWIKNDDSKFCIQFRELINEDEFLTDNASPSLNSLEPVFIAEEELPPGPEKTPPPSLRLRGLLIEDTPESRNKLAPWLLPGEVIWTNSAQDSLSHQLSYRKKFPYWGLLIECDKFDSLIYSDETPEITWRDKKVLWMQLETTSWDVLLVEK